MFLLLCSVQQAPSIIALLSYDVRIASVSHFFNFVSDLSSQNHLPINAEITGKSSKRMRNLSQE